MRGNLAKREPERIDHWESTGLYQKILEKNKDGKPFILHDGPPFTNGDIHLGHVLNKTLKDIILRYKSMQGFLTPYVVGWDCHGLPIEHAVSREMQKKKKSYTAAEIRDACKEFSEKYIGVQGEQFRRLGILTDWERDYRTMNPEYEAEILNTFAKFVEKGLVYRSKKPVYWSIPCATALAEAEIEYKDHVSPSIWVKFDVADNSKLETTNPASFVIWTTTPWTLPANLAIALHPRLDYVEVIANEESYIVVEELASSFIEACAFEDAKLGKKFRGETLEGVETRHPFIDRASPIVLADYVTTEAGTGCVHTAPGHGLEDYLTGQKYNLEIYCPLTDEGTYVDDGQIPETLVGTSVLETNGKCPANQMVLKILTESGHLLQVKKVEHQYPHCWRSGSPVVFRAMDQWFVNLDEGGMRENVLEAIGKVKWIPESGEKRIRAAVENRPDWCISRQRSWGVPLPVFYDEDNNSLLDPGIIHHVAERIKKEGTNLWFNATAEELLEGAELPPEWKGRKLKQGTDTLDVWIDSGTSHRAVLKTYPELSWPADLYLEGSDQHRGWFQSSLWTSMIADGTPPYKEILTHGFIVNAERKKLSKKDGAKSATHYMNSLGADIFRLLLASEDFSGDIPFSEEIVKQASGTYRLFRNTFRFQIGNLFDFDVEKDMVPIEKMLPIDQWVMHQTAVLIEQVTKAYEAYKFHQVYQLCNRYCAITLSAVYHDIIKDRLYTMGKNSHARRSAQSAVYHTHQTFVRLLAPILVFTTDETYSFMNGDSDFSEESIHLESFPSAKPEWRNEELFGEMEQIFQVRDQINENLEQLRQKKDIGQSLDAEVDLEGNPENPVFSTIEKYAEDLPEIFIISNLNILKNTNGDINVKARKIDGARCPRCWRWGQHPEGTICPRCQTAISN